MTEPAAPLAPELERRIRDSFGRQSMMATFGAEIVALATGECRIAAPILPGALQQHGFGHAALTFALGDTAAGYAALGLMAAGAEVLTAEMKVNLLAPARGDRLEAHGRVVRSGRRLVVVTAEVWAVGPAIARENPAARGGRRHTIIAIFQGTMIPA